jgi:hypothetical protein
VAENMDKIIRYAIIGIEAFVGFKVAVYGLRVVTTAYNIALGIHAGLLKRASIGMQTNLTAIKAMNVVTKISTALQWAFNASLWANPLTWIVIAILAVVAAIAALIYYWKDMIEWIKTSDSWFAKLLRAAIYPVIFAFKAIKFAIGWVVDKFKALIDWVKTSDNWFAVLVRTLISGIVYAFKLIGDVISWISDKFKALIDWIKTSDNAFAGFIRGAISLLGGFIDVLGKIWDWVVEFIEGAIQPLIDAFGKIGDIINLFSGETQKEMGVDISKTVNATATLGGGGSEKAPLVLNDQNSELTNALDLNSKTIDANTKAQQKQWTGHFKTTILKDMNLAGSTNIQKDLAIAALSNETDNAIAQKDIISSGKIPDKVVTSGSRSSKKKSENINGSITINVVNKTGGKFGLEVEGSGVNIVTTGNQW